MSSHSLIYAIRYEIWILSVVPINTQVLEQFPTYMGQPKPLVAYVFYCMTFLCDLMALYFTWLLAVFMSLNISCGAGNIESILYTSYLHRLRSLLWSQNCSYIRSLYSSHSIHTHHTLDTYWQLFWEVAPREKMMFVHVYCNYKGVEKLWRHSHST